MGSVRLHTWTTKNGQKREAWLIDYIAADGQRVRQIIGSGPQNRRLAKQVLAQREAEAQLGIHRLAPSETPRFGEFAADWLRRKAPGLKPKTYESYDDVITHHLAPRFGDRHLGSITRHAVEEYLAKQHREGTRRGRKGKRVLLAPRTINKALMVLKMILQDTTDQRLLGSNPAAGVRPVKAERDDVEEMHVLQPEQISKLLETATDDGPTGRVHSALYLTAVRTGLRRGELLGLRRRDLDIGGRRLFVRRSLGRIRDGAAYVVREVPLKTRYSRRIIEELPEILLDALRELPTGDDAERDYIFQSRAGGPIDPDNLDRAFKRHLALAGLPEIRFHDLRHTHASLLIAAGVRPKAIQARLGHASITTTLNTYGHLMPSAFTGVGAKLEALFMANPWQMRGAPEVVRRGA